MRLGALLCLLLIGCAHAPPGAERVATPADVQTIQKRDAERLARVKIGMPAAEFRAAFPEAYVGGQNRDVTAYEISDSRKYVTDADLLRWNLLVGFGSPSPHGERQVLWFYFRDDALVKWGQPQDWPER